MTSLLRLRGPDAEGHEVLTLPGIAPVFLGHTRLNVVDIAGGTQPMFDRNRRCCIVYNGEIYNHLAVRRELERRGHRFKTNHSDTETLLAAYQEYGKSCVDHLNGMFAFVVADTERQVLFGARDRFGEKPLYYVHDGEFFAFASEMSSLQQHPMVPRSVDQTSLIKLLSYGFVPAPRSLVRGIQKLEPGVSFSYDLRNQVFTTTQYYCYSTRVDETLEKADDDDIAEETLRLLSQSVERRLMSDVPLGVLLSGGLDSSLITALMVAQSSSPVKSFSIGFDEVSYDERVYSTRVAKQLGTDHHLAICRMSDLLAHAPGILKRLDEPFCDASLLPTWLVCRNARKQVTVALSGDGGDELFAGYDPFAAIDVAGMIHKHLQPPILSLMRKGASLLPGSNRNMSLDFRLTRALEGIRYLPSLWTPIWMAPLFPDDISKFFGIRLSVEEVYSEAFEAWNSSSAKLLGERMVEYFVRFYLPNDILTKTDRASMQNSLEVRSPYLDNDLVDFAARLPFRFKKRGSVRKFILKRAACGVLPRDIINRRKKGFGVPLRDWMRDGRFHKSSKVLSAVNGDLFKQYAEEHSNGTVDRRFLLWVNNVLAHSQTVTL